MYNVYVILYKCPEHYSNTFFNQLQKALSKKFVKKLINLSVVVIFYISEFGSSHIQVKTIGRYYFVFGFVS